MFDLMQNCLNNFIFKATFLHTHLLVSLEGSLRAYMLGFVLFELRAITHLSSGDVTSMSGPSRPSGQKDPYDYENKLLF